MKICERCKKEYKPTGRYQHYCLSCRTVILKARKTWNKGKHTLTSEHKAKMLAALLASTNRNRGGYTMSSESRANISKGKKGLPSPLRGKKRSVQFALRVRSGMLRLHADKPHKTSEMIRFRESMDYRRWREAVFQRDNYTCQRCFRHGVVLHADHIKPFSWYPELRLDISNGRTLCLDCHKQTDSYLKTHTRWYALTCLARVLTQRRESLMAITQIIDA